MRSLCLASCLLWAGVPFAAAQEAKRAAEKTETPFWLLAKTDLDSGRLPQQWRRQIKQQRFTFLGVLRFNAYGIRGKPAVACLELLEVSRLIRMFDY
jgi:hypothetical protein